ncbi:toprim domain-containing protein [Sphingomonas panacis]|nr:toprim domain-containing protein [Sphingomonas panacis]
MLASAGATLGLAEGMETAYSAMILFGLPVWATLGNERLAGITIPKSVTRLLLLPDNDRGGKIGAAKAEQAYAMPDRTIETVWPPPGFNDWNDVLRKYGADGAAFYRQAA